MVDEGDAPDANHIAGFRDNALPVFDNERARLILQKNSLAERAGNDKTLQLHWALLVHLLRRQGAHFGNRPQRFGPAEAHAQGTGNGNGQPNRGTNRRNQQHVFIISQSGQRACDGQDTTDRTTNPLPADAATIPAAARGTFHLPPAEPYPRKMKYTAPRMQTAAAA